MSAPTTGQQISITEAFDICVWSDCSTVARHETDTGSVCNEHFEIVQRVRSIETLAEQDQNGDAWRVNEPVDTCRAEDCDRPSGADGLCHGCRMDYAGDTIGNGGRRL